MPRGLHQRYRVHFLDLNPKCSFCVLSHDRLTLSPHPLAPSTENPKIWTGCAHHFHMPCIFEWMERKDTCPMCESKMTFPGLS